MAVAAMSAVALRDALADPRRTPTTARVQRTLLAASRQAWDISAGADRKMPGAIGTAVAGRPAGRPPSGTCGASRSATRATPSWGAPSAPY
jgi:hypothetical protein